jgi:MerR family copper efflux transcriptional regulator
MGLLTSGKLAAAVGVSADTIRHYEKIGALPKPPRTASGYRLYPANSVARVGVIRKAMKAGFTLEELAGILKERDSGGTPCRRVAEMTTAKLALLDEQIAELIQLREWLSATLELWKKQLARTPAGKPARLLETLAERPLRPGRRKPPGGGHDEKLSGIRPAMRRNRTGPGPSAR